MAAITEAFQASADSLQGLLRSGEDGESSPLVRHYLVYSTSTSEEARETKIQLNCTTCSLIRQGSYMISGGGAGAECPECGAVLL